MTIADRGALRLDRTGLWPGARRRLSPSAGGRASDLSKAATRAHAARQLLALGPLSCGDFTNIMGGSAVSCRRVLTYLVDCRGEVVRLGGLYHLATGAVDGSAVL
jgi:hypothetical protein